MEFLDNKMKKNRINQVVFKEELLPQLVALPTFKL
jgi:hypothetical protein